MISLGSLTYKIPFRFVKNLIFRLWLKDARFKVERIRKYLAPNDKILDLGTGSGSVCMLLENEGYDVAPLDVQDRTLSDSVEPVIYDGHTLPYSHKSFDTALILTVLHHTKDPARIISQAAKVAHRVIIIEDVYTGSFQKYLTYIFDSLFNFEFLGHPHSNKKDKEWKELFHNLGLTLKDSRQDTFLFFFKQSTYCLES